MSSYRSSVSYIAVCHVQFVQSNQRTSYTVEEAISRYELVGQVHTRYAWLQTPLQEVKEHELQQKHTPKTQRINHLQNPSKNRKVSTFTKRPSKLQKCDASAHAKSKLDNSGSGCRVSLVIENILIGQSARAPLASSSGAGNHLSDHWSIE